MKDAKSALKWYLVVAVFGCVPATAQEAPLQVAPTATEPIRQLTDAERVQQDVRIVITGVYSADIDTVLSYTHPKIITMMGGQDQAKSTLKSALAQLASSGIQIESLVFPEDPKLLKTHAHDFAIVPTKLIVSAQGKRIESLNFQFGIREIGAKTWTYIEGSRINKENVRQLFPDFPTNYEFPNFYRKLL